MRILTRNRRSGSKGLFCRSDRKGFTLIEVLITVVISAILLYGLVLMVIHMKEIMWINMQVRNLEEYGLSYVNSFTKHMRNGYDPIILTRGYPSRTRVTYIDPDDILQQRKLYEYRVSNVSGYNLPSVYIDGRRKEYLRDMGRELMPIGADSRDNIYVDQNSFRVTYNDLYPQYTTSKFDSSFITMEFSLYYQRQRSWPFRRPFEKRLDFSGSAYVINWNWPSKDDSR